MEMLKIDGSEGVLYSQEEANNGEQNYQYTFSHLPGYLSWQIFGEKFLKSLMKIEGSRGIKFKMILSESGQTVMIAIPVNKHGEEIPTEGEDVVQGGDPPACPPLCK